MTQISANSVPAIVSAAAVVGSEQLLAREFPFYIPRQPDGTDITGQIIDRLSRRPRRVLLPDGIYEVNDTIRMPRLIGWRFEGQGHATENSVRSNGTPIGLAGGFTTLLYRGPSGDNATAIDAVGQNGIMSGIDLANRTGDATTHGVTIRRPGPGLGDGKHNLSNMSIHGFGSQIRLGTLEGQGNGDESIYTNLKLCNPSLSANPDAALIRGVGQFSFAHYFYRVLAFPAGGTVYTSEGGGGSVGFFGLTNISGGTLVRFKAQPDGGTISPNARNVDFYSIKTDAIASNEGLTLVESEVDHFGSVKFIGGQISGGAGFNLGTVAPGMRLVMRDVDTIRNTVSNLEIAPSVSFGAPPINDLETIDAARIIENN